MLSREQLLTGLAPRYRDTDIAGLGTVRVQEMGVKNRVDLFTVIRDNLAAIEAYNVDQALPEAERVGLEPVSKLDQQLLSIMFSIVDENGELFFTMEDYPAITKWSFRLVSDIWAVVDQLSRPIDQSAIDEQKKSSVRSRRKGSPTA